MNIADLNVFTNEIDLSTAEFTSGIIELTTEVPEMITEIIKFFSGDYEFLVLPDNRLLNLTEMNTAAAQGMLTYKTGVSVPPGTFECLNLEDCNEIFDLDLTLYISQDKPLNIVPVLGDPEFADTVVKPVPLKLF